MCPACLFSVYVFFLYTCLFCLRVPVCEDQACEIFFCVHAFSIRYLNIRPLIPCKLLPRELSQGQALPGRRLVQAEPLGRLRPIYFREATSARPRWGGGAVAARPAPKVKQVRWNCLGTGELDTARQNLDKQNGWKTCVLLRG